MQTLGIRTLRAVRHSSSEDTATHCEGGGDARALRQRLLAIPRRRTEQATTEEGGTATTAWPRRSSTCSCGAVSCAFFSMTSTHSHGWSAHRLPHLMFAECLCQHHVKEAASEAVNLSRRTACCPQRSVRHILMLQMGRDVRRA